ncbi:MAG: T9SS type A sorting domain-containing protein, partial [Candidatus Cloacimonadaceae bacterium]|nr:T9SS type A sorting domain-containing protein [Candidatus Cloacimonadaceae bacterium]
VIIEYWNGAVWVPGLQVSFVWDGDRVQNIQHQIIYGDQLETIMTQDYFYSTVDNRLEYINTSMTIWRNDLFTRVHLEWDASGRVQTATMYFGDGQEWFPAYKTEISYHSADQSNYQTFIDYLLLQSTFGNHELNHMASRIKILEEIQYAMDEIDFEWVMDGKYEYIYDANLSLIQSKSYSVLMDWDWESKEEFELVWQEDFSYDPSGNLTEWLQSSVYMGLAEPDSRSLYSYAAPSSNPENTTSPQLSALSVFPNPFNPNTTIAFELQKADKVEMVVYNLKGQKVRSLINEHRSSGKHQISWDGKDDGGRALSSGIYFLRLSTGKEVSSRKMILQK